MTGILVSLLVIVGCLLIAARVKHKQRRRRRSDWDMIPTNFAGRLVWPVLWLGVLALFVALGRAVVR